MKLKIDEKGAAVFQDDKPLYVADDGKEIAVDVAGLFAQLKTINAESAGRRKELETLAEKVKAFDGLDAEAARKALETVKSLDEGALLTVDKVDSLKAKIGEGWQTKLAETERAYKAKIDEATQALEAKENSIRKLLIDGAFASSKFLAEKTVLPPDVAATYFGKHFRVDNVDGNLRVVAEMNGQPIFSRANPGQPANAEEAIETIIDQYAYKDRILRGAPGGAGTQNGAGTGGSGGKGMPRAQFESMSPTAQMAHIKAGGAVTE